MPKMPFLICMKLKSTAPCSKSPLSFLDEYSPEVLRQLEDRVQMTDRFRLAGIQLATIILTEDHQDRGEDLQDDPQMVLLQTDTIFTVQDPCRVLFLLDAQELVHTPPQ